MKKYIIALLVLSLLAAGAAGQENGNLSRKLLTNISLDTGNKTGHLVYEELYYSVNSSGNLTYDQGRIYFNGSITSPRVRIQIIRPYDKQGKPYPDNRIRAVATLDNKTILNGFYKVNKPVNATATDPTAEQPQTGGKKSPGFGIAAGAAAVMLSGCIYKYRRSNK